MTIHTSAPRMWKYRQYDNLYPKSSKYHSRFRSCVCPWMGSSVCDFIFSSYESHCLGEEWSSSTEAPHEIARATYRSMPPCPYHTHTVPILYPYTHTVPIYPYHTHNTIIMLLFVFLVRRVRRDFALVLPTHTAGLLQVRGRLASSTSLLRTRQ